LLHYGFAQQQMRAAASSERSIPPECGDEILRRAQYVFRTHGNLEYEAQCIRARREGTRRRKRETAGEREVAALRGAHWVRQPSINDLSLFFSLLRSENAVS